MQERLERIIRIGCYGVLITVGAATIGAALFTGCSRNDNPTNIRKDNVAVRQTKYSESKTGYENSKTNPDIEVLANSEGPELFDPRENMGLNNIEQRAQIQEYPKQEYQAPVNAVVPEPVQRSPEYQAPADYSASVPQTLPNYQAQPLQPIQSRNLNQRIDNNYGPNPSREYQRPESKNRY